MTDPSSESRPISARSSAYRPAGLLAATVVATTILLSSWLTRPSQERRGPEHVPAGLASERPVPAEEDSPDRVVIRPLEDLPVGGPNGSAPSSKTVISAPAAPQFASGNSEYAPGDADLHAPPEETAPEPAPELADATPAPAIELPLLHIVNQNDAFFVRKEGAKGLAVVMVGFDWRPQADLWTRGFKTNLPSDVQLALVMNLQGKSRMTGGMLKTMMRMNVGDEPIEIYLDWEGEMAAAYGIETGRAAALTIGPDDRLLEIAYDDRDEVKLRRLLESVGFQGEIKYQPDDPVMGTQAR